jgi:hypothetical protein
MHTAGRITTDEKAGGAELYPSIARGRNTTEGHTPPAEREYATGGPDAR